MDYMKVIKFNPYHDKAGRFAPKNGDTYTGGKAASYAARNSSNSVDVNKLIDDTLSPADAKELKGILSDLSKGGGNYPVLDTQARYSVAGAGGKRIYTKERQALHRKIVNDYIEKHGTGVQKNPEVIFLGGLGGSGKSSFGKDGRNALGVYDESKYMVIDADKVKEMMPDFSGDKAAIYHEESSHILKLITRKARILNQNVVLDQTLASPKDSVLYEFKRSGYKTQAHYMFVSPETAAKRAILRWAGKGAGKRGRLVPPSVILGMKNNPKNFDRMVRIAHSSSFYDNSGDKPAKIF